MNRIRINKRARMMMKIVMIILLFLLLLSAVLNQKLNEKLDFIVLQPEGDYVRVQDVMILSKALQEDIAQSDIFRKLEERYLLEKKKEKNGGNEEGSESQEVYLTYGEYLEILERIGTQTTPVFEAQYKPEHLLLQTDWDQAFDDMRRFYDSQGDIRKITVALSGIEGMVSDGKGNTLAENQLLTDEGEIYTFESDEFRKYNYQEIEAFCKGQDLLTVTGIRDTGGKLINVFLLGTQESELLYFHQDHEVRLESKPLSVADVEVREQLADLVFENGRLTEIAIKKDKINGKLLALSEDEITLEGQGTFSLSPQLQIYRLYDSLQSASLKDLVIGYDFTDFVMEEGKISGALITGKEAMEYIRVAVRTAGFAGLVHSEISLSADVDYTVTYGKYEERQSREYSAGEKLELTPDSELLKEGNVVVTPKVKTGKVSLLSLKRDQGIPEYRGTVEISKRDDGLGVVNEVLLEEYLYSVIPSEMPSSYPLEALKAQAICARTYAWRHLLHSGLGNIGAHVDDSVSYQVYNNVAENSNTTKAVKETTGMMLYYEEEPAGTYYYSTSCGYGTTADVWKNDSPEDTSYLQAAAFGAGTHKLPQAMEEEEQFAAFITQITGSDYEKEEPWYRWTVKVEKVKKEKMEENLKERYRLNPNLVLTLDGEEFVSLSVKRVGDIKDIYCEKRLSGGVMDELIIVTSGNTFKVISENAIRYVLNDGVAKVIRQDGSEGPSSSLLPSAFMVIETVKKSGIVTGYQLTGGGYGHGVGMSQNGARALGLNGSTCEEILNCYYGACEIREVY